MASTIVGKSGSVYIQGEVLQQSFVFKRVPRPFFELSLRLADDNQDEGILIYPYFKDTLLALIKKEPDLSLAGRKKILRCVGEAIQEFHSKNWIQIGVKPDNILVNWSCDEAGKTTIGDVALGSFDIAFKSEHGEPRETPHAIGNAMWRSPEGQTGRGVTKASDIFSFGLVLDLLLLSGDEYQQITQRGISPEQEILTRHFSYFGPAAEGLLRQVGSPDWCDALKEASAMAELAAKEQPERRFEHWGPQVPRCRT
ncbi:kinase-like domain-containing protein [Podospora didyma]|uniref:Kinase-like domain-containing protein n=1 Tax=Podospora didyma TaxID=330526 RepID=A0AAE0NQ59_9PEZI|nr:kinase-like domain-containing protein [Podospora didyma]